MNIIKINFILLKMKTLLKIILEFNRSMAYKMKMGIRERENMLWLFLLFLGFFEIFIFLKIKLFSIVK